MGDFIRISSTGISDLDEKLNEWLNWNKNKRDQRDAEALIAEGDMDCLRKVFCTRLEFGTAGLRGPMGPGYARMNDLVIVQTGQGLLQHLQETEESLNQLGVAVGYDGRHNSRRFAELTAAIFLHAGVPVYLYGRVCPTPFVPFAVTHYGCAAGIMVTASHNPKQDNGYKVYLSNGAQIVSPKDKAIASAILSQLEPRVTSWDTDILHASPQLTDPTTAVTQQYLFVLKQGMNSATINASCPISITYTAMHGVGYPYIVDAFQTAGFKPVIGVKEQISPDPDFPTVPFPNPEEGKSALDLAICTAEKQNSCLILANDPDADRLAVAERTKSGEWKVFTGNELGALLGWWSIFTFKLANPDEDLNYVYMLASTVSTKILKSMSKVEGFQFEETLTGFKWMGNRSCELMQDGKIVLFAFEEAIGFMCGTAVLDKDGISAAVRVAELAAYLEKEGMTLASKLQDLYQMYGHHISENSYFICHEPTVIKHIFDRLRNYNGSPDTYPISLCCGKYAVSGVRDLTTGYDSSTPDHRAVLPISRSSQMITFTFENGLIATLRTSGTEPKLKYYTELCASPEEKDVDHLSKTLHEMVEAIIEEYLQPKENGLIYRSP